MLFYHTLAGGSGSVDVTPADQNNPGAGAIPDGFNTLFLPSVLTVFNLAWQVLGVGGMASWWVGKVLNAEGGITLYVIVPQRHTVYHSTPVGLGTPEPENGSHTPPRPRIPMLRLNHLQMEFGAHILSESWHHQYYMNSR